MLGEKCNFAVKHMTLGNWVVLRLILERYHRGMGWILTLKCGLFSKKSENLGMEIRVVWILKSTLGKPHFFSFLFLFSFPLQLFTFLTKVSGWWENSKPFATSCVVYFPKPTYQSSRTNQNRGWTKSIRFNQQLKPC